MQSAWNGWPAWQVLFYDSLRLLVLQRERLVKGFIMSNDFMTLNGNFFLNCCQNAQKTYLWPSPSCSAILHDVQWRRGICNNATALLEREKFAILRSPDGSRGWADVCAGHWSRLEEQAKAARDRKKKAASIRSEVFLRQASSSPECQRREDNHRWRRIDLRYYGKIPAYIARWPHPFWRALPPLARAAPLLRFFITAQTNGHAVTLRD